MTADWYVVLHSNHLKRFHYVSFLHRFCFPPEVLRKVSSRITNEVAGINRVTYDISSKPPAVSLQIYTYLIDAISFFFQRLLNGCRIKYVTAFFFVVSV